MYFLTVLSQGWTHNFESNGHSCNPRATLKMHSPRLVFTHPKVPPPPPHCDHAVASAFQLAISQRMPLSCSSCSPSNHRQLSFFFFLFLFNDFWNSGNILPHFGKESLHIFKLTRGTCSDQKEFTCNVVEHLVDREF